MVTAEFYFGSLTAVKRKTINIRSIMVPSDAEMLAWQRFIAGSSQQQQQESTSQAAAENNTNTIEQGKLRRITRLNPIS